MATIASVPFMATANGEKYLRWFEVQIKTDDGELVTRVRKQIYVRRKMARNAASAA